MKIQDITPLAESAHRHPASASSVNSFIQVVKASNWKHLIDLQATYPSADYVEGRIIFNLGGNNFRIIAIVSFKLGLVVIEKVLTHAEYDKWCKKKKSPPAKMAGPAAAGVSNKEPDQEANHDKPKYHQKSRDLRQVSPGTGETDAPRSRSRKSRGG